MNVLDTARLVIYRVNKKGLEIFLVNNSDDQNQWSIPQGALQNTHTELSLREVIALDPITNADGQTGHALAIEGDWHEIPSIRSVIKEDVKIVKDQIKQRFPELEKGTYFAVKEAFKKVLPEEYAAIKELKDIMLDRNQAKYI